MSTPGSTSNANRRTATETESTGFVLVEHPDEPFGRERDAPAASGRGAATAHRQAPKQPPRQVLLQEARRLIDDGKFVAAQSVLKQVLAMKPGDPLCRAMLGRCHAEFDPCSPDAVLLCEGAARHSRSPEILFLLGRVYVLMENRKKAMKAFEDGLSLDPDYAPIHAEMSRIGTRKRPVLPFLSRDNDLNIRLGKLTKRLGLR